MAQCDLYNLEKKKVGKIELPDQIFASPVKPHLFHEVTTWQLAKRRRGTPTPRSGQRCAAAGANPGSKRDRQGQVRHQQVPDLAGRRHDLWPAAAFIRLSLPKRSAWLLCALP